jgi:RNA polymerase sigma-70 factor (ECF subfamily)
MTYRLASWFFDPRVENKPSQGVEAVLNRVASRIDDAGRGESEARPRRAAERLLADLYRTEIDRLRAYLSKMLKSEADAEDVAQEAFLRLHRHGDLTAYDKPSAVLFRTAYRLGLNKLRSRRSSAVGRAALLMDELAEAPAPAPTAEAALIAREQERAYMRALDALPARCRQVIELRTVQELSYKQMSDSLGISVSTLEKHLVRGKRVCAEALADWAVAA